MRSTMLPFARVLITAVAIAVAPGAVRAQAVAAMPAAAASTAMTASDSTRALNEMRTVLRQLTTRQEAYWADHGSYTTDMAALGFFTVPRAVDRAATPKAYPQVIFAGSRGWTGMATYRQLKQTCVIFVGNADELPKLPVTRADRRVAAEEGAPTCDAP